MAKQLRTGLLLATLLGVVAVPAAGAEEEAAESTLGPPYEQGADSGDAWNLRQADTEQGRVTVVSAYPVPVPLFCPAQADLATLRTTHEPAHRVTSESVVAFEIEQALLDPYGFLTVTVTDADGTWYGSGTVRGPVAGGDHVSLPQLTDALEEGEAPGVDGVLEIALEGAPGFAVDEQPELILEFGVALSSSCPDAGVGTASFPGITVTY